MATEITDRLLIPYQAATNCAENLLKNFGSERRIKCDAIVGRPLKQKDRIRRKMEVNGKSFGEIYDIGGARVVTHYLDDIDLFKEFVFRSNSLWKLHHSGVFVPEVQNEKEFYPGHFQDYMEEPKKGIYRSVHIVAYVDLPDYLNSHFPPKVREADRLTHQHKFPAEIQLRTILLHAWAEKGHELYSGEVASDFLNGQFFSIARLLWHLDNEFLGIRERIRELGRRAEQ